jgi:hypothetical protein
MIEQDAYRVYGEPVQGEQIGTLSARFLAAGFAELLLAWVQGELDADAEDIAADATELMLAVSERARQLAASRALERDQRAGRRRNSA